MIALRFNPRYALPAYTILERGLPFPFQEGELVSMQIVFAFSFEVSEHERAHDPALWDARIAGIFLPVGQEVDDYKLCIVQSIRALKRTQLLRFPYDERYLLEALLTFRDDTVTFPIEPGDIVTMELRVTRVIEDQDSSDLPIVKWRILLIPSGEIVEGLIVSSVQPVK